MNLLERKLLTGTYNESQEVGNDLNSLKHKTDYYRIQSLQVKQDTERIRAQCQDVKK